MEFTYYCKICGGIGSTVIFDNIRDWEYGFKGSYEYRKCLKCSSVQVHPFPSIEDLIESYKVDYHGFAVPEQKGALYSFFYKINEWIAEKEIRNIKDKGSNVLDVGCGIGLFLKKLKSMGFHKIEGIDFSERAVDAVNESGIACHRGTFIDFDKKGRGYDLIIMNNYLEHTLNPLDELKKARASLKENGTLRGIVPNFDSFDRFLFGRYWGGNHVPRHTFQFNALNLRSLLKEAGFTTIKISYPLDTSHFALSFQNFFQKRCVDLRNNSNLVHGRGRYYSLLMMSLVPINIFCVLLKKAGSMRFCAA